MGAFRDVHLDFLNRVSKEMEIMIFVPIPKCAGIILKFLCDEQIFAL
jgi:hypothetical protein